MSGKIVLLLIALIGIPGKVVIAQTLLLDPITNRFLINEPSRKPRLDVIIRSFSEMEKKEIAAFAVMDTSTRPSATRIKEGYHNVTLGRMGEQATLVVRDAEQLGDGYFFEMNGKKLRPDEVNSRITGYQLGKMYCASGPVIPFGQNTLRVSLHTADGQIGSELRITLVYARPELCYVYVNPAVSRGDSTEVRRLFPFFVRNKPRYSLQNRIPDSLSIDKTTLFFGFKRAYYDGNLQDTRIVYRVDASRPWIGTTQEPEPFIELEQKAENSTWLTDGQYELQFAYTVPGADYGVYPFTVDHSWLNQFLYYGQILAWLLPMVLLTRPWLMALVLCLIVWFWFKKRLKTSRNLARKANLELQAIQSQLNPHFVSNALSSLQGLINKHDIDRANTYLSGFSKLMRNTLHHSGKEMVPLRTEIVNIENYIQLEQLRFDFMYRISVHSQVADLQLEVPALLIQPVVENAVKHGISGLGTEGMLTLDIAAVKSDLMITIQDNGSGYDPSSGGPGKGLELTRERIKLLNKGGYNIEMETFSDKTGTKVIFNLRKWI